MGWGGKQNWIWYNFTMTNFLQLNKIKFVLLIVLFVLLVPFIEVENRIQCIKSPCPSTPSESIATFVFHNSDMEGINIVYVLIGLIFSYLVSCVITTLSRRDFMTIINVGLLQFSSAFVVHAFVYNNRSLSEIVTFFTMIIFAISGFFLGGKRKRTLVFTLIFPAILFLFLSGLFYQLRF